MSKVLRDEVMTLKSSLGAQPIRTLDFQINKLTLDGFSCIFLWLFRLYMDLTCC